MLTVIAFMSVLAALVLLLVLSIIDLRVFLLPNELVMGFLVSGIVFHAATIFEYASVVDMALGAVIGFLLLYLLRGVTEYIYKRETLGLGDVKLMGAAGVWVGADFILPAITVGALCGVVHGLGVGFYMKVKSGKFPNMNEMILPAGPGFAAGVVLVMGYVLLGHV